MVDDGKAGISGPMENIAFKSMLNINTNTRI